MNRSKRGVDGAGSGRVPASRDHAEHADLEALARSLQADPGTSVNVPFIVAEGIVVALIVLSFVYSWPLWSSLVLIVALGVVAAVALSKLPPVAPLELTEAERQRVRRVVSEHGVRPAVTLVRGLYPEESTAAASRTVKLVVERMVAEEKRER